VCAVLCEVVPTVRRDGMSKAESDSAKLIPNAP
jgi:hypothetical protein